MTERADNFREDYLREAQLGPYVNSIEVYKCPGDKSRFEGRGTSRPRVRGLSMNGYLGDPSVGLKTPGYREYRKMSDLAAPGPVETWVFIDEREEINR